MNGQHFTPDEQANFTKALRHGLDYVATLNGYQKARLADLAREKQYRAVQVHTERFERHPYAPQQVGQLDYWLDNAPAYVESQQVLALLGKPVPTATPAAEAAPAAMVAPGKLNLRQVAMLCYYLARPLTENNAAAIAADEGFTSKTSGKQLVDKYAEFCELQDSELPTDQKALSHLEKALAGLLPRLEGEAKQNAAAYLKMVREKK